MLALFNCRCLYFVCAISVYGSVGFKIFMGSVWLVCRVYVCGAFSYICGGVEIMSSDGLGWVTLTTFWAGLWLGAEAEVLFASRDSAWL